jgi:hypothetical protein
LNAQRKVFQRDGHEDAVSNTRDLALIIEPIMGLDINGTKLLLFAYKNGISFKQTATIGRQGLHLKPADLASNLRQFGLSNAGDEVNSLFSEAGGYSEPFLRLLGAEEIVSFDNSDFEGSSQVHDFNMRVPSEFRNRFSAVIDGGTLEHIFNFPTAIKNCMEMLEVNGHFLAATPANNFLGHGFYQFSPELYFRIFSAENGFESPFIAVYEETPGAPWYRVTDPSEARQRITLTNDQPTSMLVIAKKVRETQLFATPPFQSDYMDMWRSGTEASPSAHWEKRPLTPRRVLRIPLAVLRHARIHLNRYTGELNNRRDLFRKIDPETTKGGHITG